MGWQQEGFKTRLVKRWEALKQQRQPKVKFNPARQAKKPVFAEAVALLSAPSCDCHYCRPVGAKKDPDKPATPFNNSVRYKTKLEQKGYKLLGSGAFSLVMAKPNSTKVLKITRRPDNWIDYAVWAAKEGWAGKFAPKVYSYKYYTEGEFSVAVVDRYEATLHRTKHNADAHAIHATFYSYFAYGNELAGLMAEMAVPGIVSFADSFKKAFGKTNLDLHGGNFMTTKDGRLIMTDPVAGDRQETRTRLRARDFSPSLSPLIML